MSCRSVSCTAPQSSRGAGANAIRLQLADGVPAEPQRGDEALLPEAAGVQRGAQLAERGAVLLGDVVLAGLDEDEVARAVRWRPPCARSARARRDRARRARPPPSGPRRAAWRRRRRAARAPSRRARPPATRPASRARTLPVESRLPGSVITRSQKASRVAASRADDEQQAAGRVAQRLGGREDAAAHADVDRARRAGRLTGAPRPLRGPPAALVFGDLDAAGRWGHAPTMADGLPAQLRGESQAPSS